MKNETLIVAVVDKSYSMNIIRDSVIEGYNNFIREQREVGSNAKVTLVQFDGNSNSAFPQWIHRMQSKNICIDTLYKSMPIDDVPALSRETYVPRGNTPLLDAVGRTIDNVGRDLASLPQSERPDKVVFLIITDGEENASVTYTRDKIRRMIQTQENTYKWNFVFLGANIDSVQEATSLGVSSLGATANFRPEAHFVGAMYSNLSSNVANYRSTNLASSLTFTSEQRKQMDNSE